MSFYEKNLDCLKQNKRYLYDNIKGFDENLGTNRLDKIQSVKTKDGEQALIIQLNLEEYRLNSLYHPVEEAKRWSGQYNFTNMNTVISMFGFGNGIFIRQIMKNKDENDTLLIYEPSADIFLHVLQQYDIADILSERTILIAIEGINDFDFHIALQNSVSITNLYSQIHCIHPQYDKVFQESCIKFWKELKDNYFHTRININTEIHFGERFIVNAMGNLKYIRNSNTLLDYSQDLQKDIPAIVVAAGPSLRENIEELKRAKGRAYIFVVDRIIDYVLDAGIEPDFIVTVDPIKPVEYFSKREDLTIPLLCLLDSNWEVLNHHKGKKIIYSSSTYIAKMYEYLNQTPPRAQTGASVATAAFSACVKLGFKRVVLVGQDLAYDGDFTHAGGISEKTSTTIDVMVDGIDGNKVRSRYDWYEFLIWYKDMLTLHKEIEVIDSKSKGAKIQGTIVMPLKEVIDTYCTKEINYELLLNKKSSFDETDLFKVKKYFENSYEELDILKSKSEEAINICNHQIKEYKNNREESYISKDNYRKISEINKYIEDQPIYYLMESFITAKATQQLSEMYKFTDDNNADIINTYEKSKSVFQAIIDATEFVRPLLGEALEQI